MSFISAEIKAQSRVEFRMQSISLLLSALLLLTSSMYTRGGVLDCVSGEMQVKEQTKGHLSVSQLTVGDMIQGVKGAERAPAWCKVKAVYPLPHNETRTTYDGFTDTHMVVDETVHQYGVRQNGTVRIGPVYTLATDCDASVNSAGQVFTPINNGLCPFELSWDEYLTLITAIRRVANRTGYFWFDLSAYHDNDSAMVPYWGMQLSAICRSFMQCVREDQCQEFEVIMERFVHEYLNKEYVEIVERVFPNMGGDVSKEQRGTFTEVARPEKKKNYLLLFTAVGSALFALVIIVAAILMYRGQKKMTTVTRPGPKITSPIPV